ncbi:hypothetical protein BpHYR1_047921 [Brachionus plicatilis]|uniref:Uncharacterized protein n=1 Tax=Brachionus plicatilis TaxID=10195 RepID=A0A3M7RLK4_BRAPC|nr:hypothetical protein BpHYR1_047921 [Brachionus plicatilis]
MYNLGNFCLSSSLKTVMSTATLGEYVVDQVDHAHEGVLFSALHYFQNQRCHDVEALTVAYGFVVAGVGEQHPLQQSPVLLVFVSTERAAARAMKIFDYLNAKIVIVRVGAVVERCPPSPAPVYAHVLDRHSARQTDQSLHCVLPLDKAGLARRRIERELHLDQVTIET